MRNTINQDRIEILSCIDELVVCLETLRIPELSPINEKSKFYTYVNSFSVGGSGKPLQIDYKEKLLWNLEADRPSASL